MYNGTSYPVCVRVLHLAINKSIFAYVQILQAFKPRITFIHQISRESLRIERLRFSSRHILIIDKP